MALVISGVSVVISNAIVEARFPGGVAAYERECPNATYCSDGQISRVAFMAEADAKAFTEGLTRYGIIGPWSGGSSNIAIIAQHFNSLHPGDWLEIDLRTIVAADGRQFGATLAWLRGTNPTTVAVPPGWNPEGMHMLTFTDLRNSYEFVNVERGDGGSVETYRHRETGQLIHIGRPQISTAVQEQYVELLNELKNLEERPLRAGRQQALASFAERTAQLVKDSHAQEPGPLLLRGIAARLLKQWELAAESARAVTVLRPNLIEGWLDLTWALGVLGQLDEAESCARHAVAIDAQSPYALGNLASVLVQRGAVEEAFSTIGRALEIDPANDKNQRLREQIRVARDQAVSSTCAPWYRRLWGQ